MHVHTHTPTHMPSSPLNSIADVPMVVNLSLGGPRSPALDSVVGRVIAANVTVVVRLVKSDSILSC
jgi:hypothetical protein